MRRVFNDKEVSQLKELLYNNKMSYPELCDIYNKKNPAMRQIISRYKLKDAFKYSKNIGKSSSLKRKKCSSCSHVYAASEMINAGARQFSCKTCSSLTLVYYLPEEHYVGITNKMPARIKQHKESGKITDGVEILAKFERRVDAHWFETLLHIRGYEGFRDLSRK